MANELNLPLDPSRTGLTVTAVLILDNAAVGSPISCPESGALPGHYSGDMPSVAEAVYGVRFLSDGAQVGTGVIDWDGTKERSLADVEAYIRPMAKQLGLVSGISATHSPTAIVVSDGEGSTTITDNGGGSYTVALT